MTTADSEILARRHDPHSYEVLGRVMSLLCSTPGPLADCLTFHLWPLLHDGGFALSWCGAIPTEDEIVEYLVDAAADDDMTTVLRPGDVRLGQSHYSVYAVVDVRGVRFQLRPEPMFQPDTYAAMGEYWRTGELALPLW
ncbi:hypothetical protein [Nocardia gipuzkoensis]|uniref:hypothetical protein n=1 Tax=Nocardia gipuzkoensis TaxID=2749991 RepID=UPI00237D8CBD|nr:hypothetical protein [Nocardia gipuzkoensis]MDE1675279.1 hypothetical protein [Nocardia gipuzkoensis]